MEPLLELKDVSMIFENKSGLFAPKRKVGAVVGVNMQLNPGEILAVVGESGCGKTTIGKMVTGLFKPTSGNVMFMGKDIWSLKGGIFSNIGEACRWYIRTPMPL